MYIFVVLRRTGRIGRIGMGVSGRLLVSRVHLATFEAPVHAFGTVFDPPKAFLQVLMGYVVLPLGGPRYLT